METSHKKLYLRPFMPTDATTILSWCKDEHAFRMWSADRYKNYPATAKNMIKLYKDSSKACTFFPMTAFDDSGIVGHLILRYTDKHTIRFGFVIVDSAKRGCGYGKQMLLLASKYAFEFLGATKITLGVFDNNESALRCYKAAGFTEIKTEQIEYFTIGNESWKCIEMEKVRL